MIGVSKTFGGSSILSSPALEKVVEILEIQVFQLFFVIEIKIYFRVFG